MFTISNYVKAKTLEEAYELNQARSSRVMGGMMWMRLGNARIKTLIDLSDLGLDKIEETDNVIRIGTSPMTPAQVLVDLWPELQADCPGVKFQLVPFDNTPENAREILANLGQRIDVVAGIFDETMLNLRRCAGLEISREPICCAVSVHHRLAQKESLTVQDLYGERLMLMRRDWSHYVDLLRDDLWKNHPQIHIADFDFYDVGAFNQCENNNCVLMAIENWRYVHPLLKISVTNIVTTPATRNITKYSTPLCENIRSGSSASIYTGRTRRFLKNATRYIAIRVNGVRYRRAGSAFSTTSASTVERRKMTSR